MALKKKASVTPVAEKEEEQQPIKEPVKETKVAKAKVKKATPAPTQETPLEVVEEAEVVSETAESAAEPTTEVATRQDTAVAQAAQAAQDGGVLAKANQGGFGGLSIGFGSFPILKIQNGHFNLDGEELDDREVHLNIRQSRSKYLIRQAGASDEDVEFIYSYDGINDLSGGLVEEWAAKQKLAGFEIETKEYVEAVAEILDEGEHEGDYCILSIPPSGRSRFSGYVAQLSMQRGVLPDAVITLTRVGKPITKGNNTWNPWTFKYHSMMED